MILTAGWVVSKAIPSSEMARLRNALIAQVGSQADFDWLPPTIPPSFHQEDISGATEFSNYIHARLSIISASSQLEKSLGIAHVLLSHNDPNAEAIMSNSSETLRLIVENGAGYCADYTQVFNGAAYLYNIPVREWGLSFDGFGGKGHAISEIYDQKIQKWVLLDTFYAFYLEEKSTNTPISVMQFQHLLQTNSPESLEDKINVIKIKPNRFGFPNNTALFEYFSHGKNHFYLWWGNDALSYDNNPFVSFTSKISRHTEQLVAIALGIHQKIRLLPNKENSQDIEALLELKTHLLYAFLIEIILGVILTFRCLQLFVNRKIVGQSKSQSIPKAND